MIYALIYLYVGILFAEVSRFGMLKIWWVYPLTLFTWPVLVPVIIIQGRRGK